MQILACIGCFVAGAVMGGVLVYVINLKKYHAADMDETLAHLECINSNCMTIHENFKKGVVRFGKFADEMQRHMSGVDEHVARIDLEVRKNLKGSGVTLEALKKSHEELVPLVQETKDAAVAASDQSRQALDRLKLMA